MHDSSCPDLDLINSMQRSLSNCNLNLHFLFLKFFIQAPDSYKWESVFLLKESSLERMIDKMFSNGWIVCKKFLRTIALHRIFTIFAKNMIYESD